MEAFRKDNSILPDPHLSVPALHLLLERQKERDDFRIILLSGASLPTAIKSDAKKTKLKISHQNTRLLNLNHL